MHRGQIKDLIADGDAAARLASGRGDEDAEWKILDREVGVAVCRGHPAAPPGIMREIER